MNCPSRPDNSNGREGWNQSPNQHSGTTREDFNGMANARVLRRIETHNPVSLKSNDEVPDSERQRKNSAATIKLTMTQASQSVEKGDVKSNIFHCDGPNDEKSGSRPSSFFSKARNLLMTFGKFVGPGFMISVAYIDPGNYSTDISAGADHQFQLLFIVLLSNFIAIFLQSLCIKLGTVTGMDLAQMCRAHLPRWLNLFLYFLAECAIIATDIAEVIGTAIAIHLLIPAIPLVAGCAISIVDVLLILLFYRPDGSMKGLRAFEIFVMALVLGVVVCFCWQLARITDTSIGEVFRGYLPSSEMFQTDGLYQACGILGATVMPHSLYLGSGIVQPRLLDYDIQNGYVEAESEERSNSSISSHKSAYQPSLAAIKFCLKYSVFELALSLFTFALFVNSAILIVAGSSLQSSADYSHDIFGINQLLSDTIAPAAGTIFALALLLSGISAGIICTIAGQMVSEGALNWSLAPWLRRLVTRCISIIPSIIIAGAVGENGLTAALNGSQVALSVVLPFVSAPLIYFTCRNKYMTVKVGSSSSQVRLPAHDYDNANERNLRQDVGSPISVMSESEAGIGMGMQQEDVKMRNHWVVAVFAVLIWLIIATMNFANLVLIGTGAV